jgi:hypothetical protein
MIACESRQIPGPGGYARSGSVGGLTTVSRGRSESGARVLGATVVKKSILEGKR